MLPQKSVTPLSVVFGLTWALQTELCQHINTCLHAGSFLRAWPVHSDIFLNKRLFPNWCGGHVSTFHLCWESVWVCSCRKLSAALLNGVIQMCLLVPAVCSRSHWCTAMSACPSDCAAEKMPRFTISCKEKSISIISLAPTFFSDWSLSSAVSFWNTWLQRGALSIQGAALQLLLLVCRHVCWN